MFSRLAGRWIEAGRSNIFDRTMADFVEGDCKPGHENGEWIFVPLRVAGFVRGGLKPCDDTNADAGSAVRAESARLTSRYLILPTGGFRNCDLAACALHPCAP